MVNYEGKIDGFGGTESFEGIFLFFYLGWR